MVNQDYHDRLMRTVGVLGDENRQLKLALECLAEHYLIETQPKKYYFSNTDPTLEEVNEVVNHYTQQAKDMLK